MLRVGLAEEVGQLAVAVLLDHVDHLLGLHVGVHLGGEGQGPQAQVVGLEPPFCQEVLGLDDGGIAGTEGEDALV